MYLNDFRVERPLASAQDTQGATKSFYLFLCFNVKAKLLHTVVLSLCYFSSIYKYMHGHVSVKLQIYVLCLFCLCKAFFFAQKPNKKYITYTCISRFIDGLCAEQT